MTPNQTDCIPEQFKFEQVKSCPVIVNFQGETVTSDAGLTLIAELDRKREITLRREMHVSKITENKIELSIR